MANKAVVLVASDGTAVPLRYVDNGDGTFAEQTRSVLVDANGNAYASGVFAPSATPTGVLDAIAAGIYNVTPPTLADGQYAPLQLGSKAALRVALFPDGSTTAINNMLQNADGASATNNGLAVGGFGYRYNETAWDRDRGNTQATIFASAARTAATLSATLTNYNARGALFHLRVTAKAGATTLGFNVFPIDLVANTAITAYATTTGIAAAAGVDYYWLVYPGVATADVASGGAKSLALPRQYQLQAAPSDASSVTYSVDVSYIL